MAKSRGSFVTLFIAVAAAFVAIYFVQREINKNRIINPDEEKTKMVFTARAMEAGESIARADLKSVAVPSSAVPPQAIKEHQMEMVLGQKLKNKLPQNAYVMLGDVDFSSGLHDIVSAQKWAISVSLNGGAINRHLRPNDEIAIIGTLDVTTQEAPSEKDPRPQGAKPQVSKKRKVTTVILPKVRILALDSNRQQGGDEFILELPPQEAQLLLAAQARGIELSPALRNRNDGMSNLNRKETKLVDDTSFNTLVQDVESIIVPVNYKDFDTKTDIKINQ